MTITNSISSQSIGTSTNVGAGLFPQKITKQTLTTAFTVSARITNGASEYKQINEVRIWYASSNFSVTAAVAVTALKTTARYLDVRPEPNAGGVAIRAGDLLTVNGDYIYFWCEIPAASVAQTLDVSCVELP